MFRQLGFASVLLLMCATPMEALAFQESDTVSELNKMQTELESLQQTFGKDHPKVVAMKKRIGLVTRLNELVSDSPNQKAMIGKLYPLLIEEQELLSKFGKDHPKLKLVRGKIKLVAEFYGGSDQPSAKATGSKAPAKTKAKPADTIKRLTPLLLKEQELISIYGEKHPRVVRLQKEIDQLRKKMPKGPIGQARVGGRGPAQGNKSRPVDDSPSVEDDKDKPGRYSMEKKDGNVILLDRQTGQSWMLKLERGVSRWIPIPRTPIQRIPPNPIRSAARNPMAVGIVAG